ncbi:MAG: tRNA (adenosine(37)-N6)-threonylcarbamoyltransferase complex transferase subunit TsaD [Candidatus Nanohaloarchaeota archaeon]|nr:tRNA (adenosine(37)-N6)-threonylcarbamoyltransferase complex transferase subunit TsaD [Candidatus Nanohaloarchaeota archaeon]
MNILAFEGTAHTASVAIVKKGKIVTNLKHSYTTQQPTGMVPREVAEHHASHLKDLTLQALKQANVSMREIDVLAYSAGPGLGAALQVINSFVTALSIKHNLLLYPIHHSFAHLIVANYIAKAKDPLYIYVSGGNTQLIMLKDNLHPVVYGETEDIALGNALDKLARELGYGFPGGKHIEDAAKKADKFIEMPYTVKGMDLSYAGLVTFASKLKDKETKENIAYGFQEHAFAMLMEVAERALAYTEKEEVVLTGGVALNSRLQEMLKSMAEERGIKYLKLEPQYLGDNAAMIGVAAWHFHLHGIEPLKSEEAFTKPRWRIEKHLEW